MDGGVAVCSKVVRLWGLFRGWGGRARWRATSGSIMIAGILMGAGGFNFYDGIIQHAILHFHLVNEHVCPVSSFYVNNSLATCPQDIPYEVVWDLVGFIILAIGVLLCRENRRALQNA